MKPLDKNKLIEPIAAARYLLGGIIVRTLPDGTVLSGKIVETEAYHEVDPASHTFGGKRVRNAAMFGPPGHAYIYFTYGMHWCFNVTAGPVGYGAGILIRAVEPVDGIEKMKQIRKMDNILQLTNGPAKLAQALAIDKSLYGHDLTNPPLQIFVGEPLKPSEITISTRIGISQAAAELLRFYINDSPFISKK